MESEANTQNNWVPSSFNPSFIPAGPEQDFFRFRIDAGDILEEIEHQLKGEVLTTDRDGKQVYTNKFKPWMNEEGINKVLYIIYSCGINKNIILGNLTKEQIDFRCNKLKKKLARFLYISYDKYGLKKEMIRLLIATIVNNVHSGLSRCEGGKESYQLSTATQRHEIYSDTAKTKKSGMSLNPLSWFKGD